MVKYLLPLIACLSVFALGASSAHADLVATTDDGRRVLLRPDGTWDFVAVPRATRSEELPDAKAVTPIEAKPPAASHSPCAGDRADVSEVNAVPQAFADKRYYVQGDLAGIAQEFTSVYGRGGRGLVYVDIRKLSADARLLLARAKGDNAPVQFYFESATSRPAGTFVVADAVRMAYSSDAKCVQ